MTVGLIVCFARSGGTVLNRCLGSLPKTVVVSEVNPLGSGGGDSAEAPRTVWDQAREWYDIELQSREFAPAIAELEAACDARDMRLVVRDWSFCNFVPLPLNNGSPPQRLLALEQLRQAAEPRPVAFVRDAIDVWISRSMPDPDTFFGEYLAYLRAIKNEQLPLFRYEDFCARPDEVMAEMCTALGIVFSHSYRDYARFHKVSGDVQVAGGSRGTRQQRLAQLPRRRIPKEKVVALEGCQLMKECNELVGYPSAYAGRPLESPIRAWADPIDRVWNRVTRWAR